MRKSYEKLAFFIRQYQKYSSVLTMWYRNLYIQKTKSSTVLISAVAQYKNTNKV